MERKKTGPGLLLAACLAPAIVACAFLAFSARWSWEDHLREKTSRSETLARAIAGHSELVFAATGLELQRLADHLGKEPELFGQAREGLQGAVARAQWFQGGLPSGLAIYDREGALLARGSEAGPRPPTSLAGSETLARHLSHDSPELVIVPPHGGAYDSLALSACVRGPDGRFVGIVMSHVPAERFLSLYIDIPDVERTTLLLVRQDGRLLLRHPRPTGGQLEPLAPWTNSLIQGRADGQVVEVRSVIDGARRFAVHRTIGERGIDAVVTMPVDGLLQSWFEEADYRLALHLALSIAAIALALAVHRRLLRGRARAEARAARGSRSLDATRRNLLISEARFRDGIAAMRDGFALWDAHDRLVAWNDRYVQLHPGMADHIASGATFADVCRAAIAAAHARGPAAGLAAEASVAERIRLHRMRSGERTIPYSNGRVLAVSESPTSDGGTVSTYRDVTEEHRLLAQLQESERALRRSLVSEREATAAERRFVAMASHEFRTPLAVIDGAAQRIAARITGDEEITKRLDRIRGAVSRMVHIIERTLSAARLEEGHLQLATVPVDLGSVLAEACERQRQIAPEFEIALDVVADLSAIDADPRLLEQVFANLLSNAVKYSGTSRVVRVSARRRGDQAEVAFADAGVGIDAEDLPRLFTRFFRARTSAGLPGTGIGLHLARELVRMHGGDMEVDSVAGRGSTFSVLLPARAAQQGRAAAE
jgi:signal transduction histidine kinase